MINRYLTASMMLKNANGKSIIADSLKQGKELDKQAEKFVFHAYTGEDAELAKHIKEVEIKQVADNMGNIRNSVSLIFDDGDIVSARLYGTEKKVYPAVTIKGEELKKVQFGYCTSGTEVVRDSKVTPAGVTEVRRRYANISALTR